MIVKAFSNFWDNASTLPGEVEQPHKTFPKALFFAELLTYLVYLIPLLVAIGAIPLDQEDWVDGYFVDVAEIIAGKWLKVWIEIGSVLLVIGFEQLCIPTSRNVKFRILPQIFGVRSTWFNTPWVQILLSTLITLVIAYMSFVDIISSVNFLYSLEMLLEFVSFIWLRRKLLTVKRPFVVPMGLPWSGIMCLIPSGFLLYVMAVATKTVYLVTILLTLAGIAWYFLMNFCKSKMWLEFNNVGEKLEDQDLD